MNSKRKIWAAVLALIFMTNVTWAQDKKEEDHSYKPLTVKLDESGSKYVRFILWHQIWSTSNNLAADDSKFRMSTSIRRSRLLAFAQVSPKFMILTHFGLNGLNEGNLTTLGSNGDAPQLFLHGAWGELKLSDGLYLGAGLHYWKGLTRLANQSTLNFMTLDQSRPFNAWHSLGITDQFARHLGIYLKGASGKLEYRFALNQPAQNTLGNGIDFSSRFNAAGTPMSNLTYTGASTTDSNGDIVGRTVFEGYVKYNFFDNEGTKLPYYVGTYLGKKKVFAIGAGFFSHAKGMYDTSTGSHENVGHVALDAFLDIPTNGGALNAYAAIQSFNYGENYISRWGGTGSAFYGQLGYYIKSAKVMPYIAISSSNYDGADESIGATNIGLNYFINGHNCKVTAEYHGISRDYREGSMTFGGQDQNSQFRVQLHIFL